LARERAAEMGSAALLSCVLLHSDEGCRRAPARVLCRHKGEDIHFADTEKLSAELRAGEGALAWIIQVGGEFGGQSSSVHGAGPADARGLRPR
jgi:hypothetical protein